MVVVYVYLGKLVILIRGFCLVLAYRRKLSRRIVIISVDLTRQVIGYCCYLTRRGISIAVKRLLTLYSDLSITYPRYFFKVVVVIILGIAVTIVDLL